MNAADSYSEGTKVNGLRNLNLREEYRSDHDDLARDLFIPCLSVATHYDRAVGYFTSAGLAAAARGLKAFVDHEGRMRLIASPFLTEQDIQAIERGISAQTDVVERALLRQLAVDSNQKMREALTYLSWLIAEQRLDVRIALPNSPRRGIYHEKVGIFSDTTGDRVAVSGSANETQGGLIENFEAIDVFTSWDATARRTDRKQQNFARLWENETRGLQVIEFPDAVKNELLTTVPPRQPETGRTGITHTHLAIPTTLQVRPYQARAVEAWEAAERVGILAMATGSGKTKTSLVCAAQLQEEHGPLAIVVLAPYLHLVDQWANEITEFGLHPVKCYESSRVWYPRARQAVDLFSADALETIVFVATHATAGMDRFRNLLNGLPGERLLIIADEAHHLGSEVGFEALPQHARYRLGLSATPERWEDPVGTDALFDYFGGVVFEFSIKDAIDAGCLCPYEYMPDLVELTPWELEEYEIVTQRVLSELTKNPPEQNQTRLKNLLDERSRILDGATGKMDRLRSSVVNHRPDHTLVYCANRTQLGATMEMLWDRGISARQFTAEEPLDERSELLDDFALGTTAAIVAMKCLDEGVDVPPARSAEILASSGNPREWVQRRGRLLRTFPGKERATIRDYVVFPESDSEGERELLRREIRRVVGFADAADNRGAALEVIWPLMERYGLFDELGGVANGRA